MQIEYSMNLLIITISLLINLPGITEARIRECMDLSAIIEINEYRVSNGLNRLEPSCGLSESAKEKSELLERTSFWGHSPTGDKDKDIWDFIYSKGKFKAAGENLAEGFKTRTAEISAWKKSPTHNEVLLGKYTDAGIYTKCGVKFPHKKNPVCLTVLHTARR